MLCHKIIYFKMLSQFTPNCHVRVPTRTGKPGKMGRHFPVREKSGNFKQTGKVRENHTKYWKTQGIWNKYYLIFLVIFKWTVYYLLKMDQAFSWKNRTLKNTGKWQKYWKSQGILSVRKSGNPACVSFSLVHLLLILVCWCIIFIWDMKQTFVQKGLIQNKMIWCTFEHLIAKNF